MRRLGKRKRSADLLDPLPMLLPQPVIQYYANVGGGAQRAVIFGFRAKVEF
jgi:porin